MSFVRFGRFWQKQVKEIRDSLAGIGATSKLERVAAKEVLRNLTIADLKSSGGAIYEIDFVTRIIQDDI